MGRVQRRRHAEAPSSNGSRRPATLSETVIAPPGVQPGRPLGRRPTTSRFASWRRPAVRSSSTGWPSSRVSNVPDEHSGSDVYFDLTFSEEPDVGYRDVQRAFRVSGGSINSASRKSKGSNLGWKLKVRPSGTGSLTTTLPETTDCDTSRVICTDNGWKLSHSTSERVQGQVGISIADGEVEEAAGARVVFTVSLSEPAAKRMTVAWATPRRNGAVRERLPDDHRQNHVSR